MSSGISSLFKKKSLAQQCKQPQSQTPESPNTPVAIDLKNLERTEAGFFREFKAFIMGIGGGDCAGKKELINFMFDKQQIVNGEDTYWTWKMAETGESVAVLHQAYFIKNQQLKYMSEGTDWSLFRKKALSLSLGNQITISIKQGNTTKKIKIAPAKVICIEGSHIFCANSQVDEMINMKVFIDTDSDIRLSRRIYKDTVENGMLLDQSIIIYLSQIKKSYEGEIDPTKVNCDLVVPHFGNGYADHKIQDKSKADINMKNISNILLNQVKSAIKLYEEMEQEEIQKKNLEKKNQTSPTKQIEEKA